MVLVWFGTKLDHFKSLLQEYTFKEVAPFYFIGFSTFCLAVFSIVAFQANFIQLGLDQLMDTLSRGLNIFIRLAVWANILGTILVAIGGTVARCPPL